MDIRNTKELTVFAGQRLETARDEKKIVTIFAAIVIGLSALTAILNYVLDLRMDQSGGLSNLGTRSVLSTMQTILPIIQTVIAMCLEMGYLSAMLRIARGQYASLNSLRLGFDRFWVLLRYRIYEWLLLFSIGFSCMYLAISIYVLTPLADPVVELLTPLLAQSSALNPTISVPDAMYDQLMQAMIPAFVMFGILYCLVAVPMIYRMRMTPYILIDKPGMGAMAAIRESRKMMKGNCMHLFRMDLRLWWFFAAQLVISVVAYGDMLLPMMGFPLPFSQDFSFFLFYGIYWTLEFLVYFYLRNRVEVSYALAYDAVKPEEPRDTGVVLGNIFQM